MCRRADSLAGAVWEEHAAAFALWVLMLAGVGLALLYGS